MGDLNLDLLKRWQEQAEIVHQRRKKELKRNVGTIVIYIGVYVIAGVALALGGVLVFLLFEKVGLL